MHVEKWSPLLEAEAAGQALAAVEAIARDLAGGGARDGDVRGSELERLYPHSLGFGEAGVALFFDYLGRTTGHAGAASTARGFIGRAVEGATETRMPPDLYRGFSGIAWAYEHMKGGACGGDASAGDEYEEIDEALTVWSGGRAVASELLEGLGGVCLFALERLPHDPAAARLIERVLDAIEGAAEHTRAGTTWRVPSRVGLMYEKNEFVGDQDVRALFDRGVYKLCVAHGITGTAGALAALHANGVGGPAARELAEGGISWLLTQKRDAKRVFPQMVGLDLPQVTTGWCNGDLGICVALFNAALALGRADWEAAALDIARKEAAYRVEDIEEENRDNYTLCHGSAGRLHLFNRLYQATGEAPFAEAARFWLTHTLKMQTPGRGTGGFLVAEPALYGGPKNARGFLMGAAGLGLALLAAAGGVVPAWDRVLLASVPYPRAACAQN
jgi:hypothetical protein